MATVEQALKEAQASVKYLIHETIELRHEDVESLFYIVNESESLIAQLEDGNQATFDPIPFKVIKPNKDEQGFADMTISIDNINREPSDFINSISRSQKPLFLIYREYTANNLVSPSATPLKLTLKDVKVTPFEVTARATFANIRNKKFANQNYTRNRFPSLGN